MFTQKLSYIILSVVILSTTFLEGQSIAFIDDNLDSALKIAAREGKNVFVDTYAPWCIPCKKMKKVFNDGEVGRYFNDHYISVRINMDNPIGSEIRLKYDVIFLPTFLILDSKGDVKYQVDRVLSKEELLDIGRMVKETNGYFASESTAIVNNPIGSNSSSTKTPQPKHTIPIETKKIEPKKVEPAEVVPESTGESSEEKILYVLGASDDIPPEILKQESYFRMQLMDGSHRKTAKQYLATQEDWGTDENMKFIHDFLHITNSDEFKYYIINRHKFEKLLGKQKVQENVEILVYKTINQGFPRPTQEEAQALYSYVDPSTSRTKGYTYMLDRHFHDQNYRAYSELAEKYLKDIKPEDPEVTNKLCSVYAETSENVDINRCIKMMKRALELKPEDPSFYDTMAFLYYKKNDRNEALNYANRGIDIAKRRGYDYRSTLKLLEMIKEL